MLHKIHIPVMGICYTVDSPIRVAPFGITSVISLVDDGLLEEYRMAYAEREGISVGKPEQTRVGRIRAYLDFVEDEAERRFFALQSMRFVGGTLPQYSNASAASANDKDKYFLMLPPDSPLKEEYMQVCPKSGLSRIGAEATLTAKMKMGEIQANIMVSLNHKDAALDAVRGFAESKVRGSLVLSAGINLGVFEEIAKHKCFYRQKIDGEVVAPEKKIILKVSDYRSALTQGKYLAKKGLEVYEYRIESGVNCGGHAFFGAKKLMPDVIREFMDCKENLFETTRNLIAKISIPPTEPSRITAQGGICNAEEVAEVLSMGVDGVGVGTPFLLVPQATSCDKDTRRRLAAATSSDVVLSRASPLGVPFMNLLTSTAAELCREKANRILFGFTHSNGAAQTAPKPAHQLSTSEEPGFLCRQHYLCREISGFNHPLCMASRDYVLHRLAEISAQEASGTCTHEAAQGLRKEVLERECICRFLGNAGREELRERSPSLRYDSREIAAARAQVPLKREPVSVCPGPDIAYFTREYTLLEMMQHLYGTGPSLTPADKPSAFEIEREIMQKVQNEA